jgi:hypothetical protein
VVLEYPPGKAPAASARLRLRLGSADSYIGTTLDSTARTLTATLDTFGGSTVQVLAAPPQERAKALSVRRQDTPADSDGTLSVQATASLADSVASARARLAALVASGQFADALALQLSTADLLMRSGDPDYTAQATSFLDEAHNTACAGLAVAITASQTAPINAPGDFKPLAAKILYWETFVQQLGGSACSGGSPLDAVDAVILRELAFLRNRFPAATTPAEFGPPAGDVKDTRTLKAEAGALKAAAPAASAAAAAADNVSTTLQVHLIDPAMEPARNAAWTAAASGGTLGQYPVLVAAFGGAGVLAQDAQYVRTRIAVASTDSSGNAVGDATLGFASVPAQPADPVRSAAVPIRSGGTLALSGNVATLDCATAGSETLQVTFENVPVRSVSGSGGNLLAGVLASLTPAGLLQAAGLPDTDTGTHPLVLRRTSPCSAALGITDEVIGTVMVDFGAAVMAFSSVSRYSSLDKYQGDVGVCLWTAARTSFTLPFTRVDESSCGVFRRSIDARLTDPRTLTVSLDLDLDQIADALDEFEFTVTMQAAGTLTLTANPAWKTSSHCTAPLSAEGYTIGGSFNMGVSANHYHGDVAAGQWVDGGSANSFICNGPSPVSRPNISTLQVDAGDQIVIQSALWLADMVETHPITGRGVAYTLHFDPRP